MRLRRRRAFAILLCAYAALVAAVSLLPSGTGPLKGWDTAITPTLQNAGHVPAYAILAFLGVLALLPARPLRVLPVAVIALLCCGYGVGLEFAQAAIPGRTGSVSDSLLNCAGVVIGLAAAVAARRLRPHKPTTPAGLAPAGPAATRGAA
jgi:VanZ family protein